MNKKIEYKVYKIIVLAVLILALGITVINYSPKDKIDLGGIEIESYQLRNIVEPLPEGSYALCDIEKDICNINFKKNIGVIE